MSGVLEKILGWITNLFPESWKLIIEVIFVLVVVVLLIASGGWMGSTMKQHEVDVVTGQLNLSQSQYSALRAQVASAVQLSTENHKAAVEALRQATEEAKRLQPSLLAAQQRLDLLYSKGLQGASGVATSCEIEVIQDKETR